MFRIAVKSLLARKRRLFTTGFAIILGVAFMSGTLVLSDTLDRAVRGLIGEAFVGVDGVVRSATKQENDFGPAQRTPLEASVADTIRGVDGVAEVHGVVQGTPILFDQKGKSLSSGFGAPTIAQNWFSGAITQGTIVTGHPPRAAGEVVIDRKTVADNHFRLGDTIKVQTLRKLGEYRLVGTVGLGEDGADTSGAKFLLFTTPTAQELFGKTGKFDYIEVAADQGVSQQQLAGAIRRELPSGVEAITGSSFIAEQQAEVAKLVDIVTQAILAFGYISIFVGTFIIYNTFSILITQRTREMALLRAVGAGRGQILGSVLAEATIIGVIAGVVGLAGGFALATVLKGALGQVFTLPGTLPRLTWSTVLTSVLVGFGVTVVSAMMPAFRATRIPPVAAMGEVAVDRSAVSVSRRVFGTLFLLGGITLVALVLTQTADLGFLGVGLGAACIFLSVLVIGPVFASPFARLAGAPLVRGLGVTGRLARENAARNPKRTTATAAALTVGVAVVTVIAVMASSVKESVNSTVSSSLSKADLIVDSGNAFPGVIPYSAETELASVPGVDAVSPNRFTLANVLNSKEAKDKQAAARAAGTAGADDPARQPGESTAIVAIDPDAFFRIADLGRIRPTGAKLGDDQLFVLAKTASDNGWKVGDEVTIRTATDSGAAVRTLRISGTFDTRLGGGELFTNLATFDRISPVDFRLDNSIYLGTAPGADVATVKRAVAKVIHAAAPAATVTDVAGYVKERTQPFDTILTMIYVLMALAIIIALFGIRNTLALSILERTRELGLLRAVGMQPGQLRRSIRWESAIIAVFGTLMGIVIGVVFAIAVVIAFDEKTITPVLPWVQLVAIVVLGLLAGILAARKPAKRAARLDVLDAIAVA